jgi:hypothetical protein
VHEACGRVMKRLVPLCCAAPAPDPDAAGALCAFVRTGSRAVCRLALGEEAADAITIRVAAASLHWLSARTESTRRVGEQVLQSVVGGEGARCALSSAVCAGVRLELERGRLRMIRAARVLLASGAGDASLVVACLQLVVEKMRIWRWTDGDVLECDEDASAGAVVGADDVVGGRGAETSEDRCHFVHEALCGADTWTRAQTGRGGKWGAEHTLQLIARCCASRHVPARTIILALRICAVSIKQAQAAAASSESAPSGILWGVRGAVAAILSRPSRLDADTMVALSRVHETVAAACCARGHAAAPPVAVAMTVDAARALTEVTSGAVRRAASAGVGALLGAGGSGDCVAGAAMVLLDTDAARDVLRAVRAEFVDDGAVYRGRA